MTRTQLVSQFWTLSVWSFQSLLYTSLLLLLIVASLSCVLGLSNEGSPMVCIQSGGDTPNNSHGSVFHFWHGSQRGLVIAEHRDCLRPLKRNLIIGSV